MITNRNVTTPALPGLSHGVICTMDAGGNFLDISEASSDILGYKPRDLKGKKYIQLVVNEHKPRVSYVLEHLLGDVLSCDCEIELKHRNGAVVPVYCKMKWNRQNETIDCLIEDLTEKRKLQKKLEVYKHRLEKVQQMAKVGIWEYDLIKQEPIWCSNEIYNILGLQRNEHQYITPAYFVSLVHPEDKHLVPLDFNDTARNNGYNQEHRMITPSGKLIYVRNFIEVVYENNKAVQLVGTIQNITEQKEAEIKVTESERKYRSLVQNGFDMIIILDNTANYKYVSDSAYKLFGRKPEDIIGTNAFELVHPDDLGYTLQSLARLFTEPFVDDAKPFRYKAESGEWRWVEAKGANMLNDPGINGLVLNARDITDRVRLQEQLLEEVKNRQNRINKAAIKAQELERSKLGRELHDNVNQVLTTVKLYTELCMDPGRDIMPLLKKSASFVSNCIDEIRGISKRLSTPTLGKISLSDSITELVNSFNLTNRIDIRLKANKPRKHITQEVHIGIYRIIQEHLTNIVKHAAADKVSINIQYISKAVRIEIRDNGKGFDPCRQSNGIGISNMHSRAESLNGDFELVSKPGEGCALRLLVPAA